MLRRTVCLIGLLFLFASFAFAAEKEPNVRIGLVVNQFSAEVVADGPFKIAAVEGGNGSLKFGAQKIFISVKEGSFQADGKNLKGSQFEVLPENDKTNIQINRKNYRGRLLVKIAADKKTLTVINVLPVEAYLYGVVAKEIIPLWPEEAIKAQIVAARSFVLSAAAKNTGNVFDVRANEMGQVYGGIAAENAKTNELIDATKGIVASYNGKPIEAYYHSTSGGYTENSENVWSSKIPYLQGVKDFDQEAPKYTWDVTFTVAELQKLLEQGGYKIGNLKSIKLSPLTDPPMQEHDRGVSGRVLYAIFSGDKGEATIEGGKLRTLLQLNSTLFEITVGLVTADSIEVPIVDRYGRTVGTKKIPVNVKGSNKPVYTGYMAELRLVSGAKNEKIIFSGRGWGHGLGLSQWGARGMALAAPKGSKDYYKKILGHYYTGITINKIY